MVQHRLDTAPARLQMTEQVPGLLGQDVAFDITGRHQIDQRIVGQILDPRFLGREIDIVPHFVVIQGHIATKDKFARRGDHAAADVSEQVAILMHVDMRNGRDLFGGCEIVVPCRSGATRQMRGSAARP